MSVPSWRGFQCALRVLLDRKSRFGGAAAEYVVKQMVKYDYITRRSGKDNYKINSVIHKSNGFEITIKAVAFISAIPTKL